MFESVLLPGTATVSEAKQSNAIKNKTKDVSSNTGEVTKHYDLDDFDILRVLSKVCMLCSYTCVDTFYDNVYAYKMFFIQIVT